jgi:hypothetical protein
MSPYTDLIDEEISDDVATFLSFSKTLVEPKAECENKYYDSQFLEGCAEDLRLQKNFFILDRGFHYSELCLLLRN